MKTIAFFQPVMYKWIVFLIFVPTGLSAVGADVWV